MKRMRFEPPTNHYDHKLEAVDEQICQLIHKRKEISNNNSGFPTKELILKWSKKYNFYEDFLNSTFSHFFHEEVYKPVVEPRGFQKNVPVLKSFETDGTFYTVTFVRQYRNASIVHFTMDKEDSEQGHRDFEDHSYFDLSISGGKTDYDCRNNFGGGSGTHHSFTYTVSPALPENLSDITFIFQELKLPFQKPTGVEFEICLGK
ncbi:hypothetical protein D3H55_20400 [Bacillus salacetis]|uniref:Uncharacterized protein n=1 Tax=Bacillus salacetis TaxID=2315464 RepID=A0A3A1QUA6_9BACI|nr:hypothetical protein [Bacillus salacetis]RIW28930.1 hypothetical protein D3H55_20400 [Bacillus salacetis]